MNKTMRRSVAAAALLAFGGAQAALVELWDTADGAVNDRTQAAAVISGAAPTLSVYDNTIDYYQASFPGDFGIPGLDGFVMRVTGTIDTALYDQLAVFHDDGFAISINGGDFFVYNGNTPPVTSYSGALANVGVASFEMIFWDQAGDQAAWIYGRERGGSTYVTAEIGNPVPTPGSLALAGLGLAVAGLATRRRRAA